MIDLDELLNGNPTWQEVVEFFQKGEFYEEHYSIEAIKKYLLTQNQKETLYRLDLSIEDILNGRVHINGIKIKHKIFQEWNDKLGFIRFGY